MADVVAEASGNLPSTFPKGQSRNMMELQFIYLHTLVSELITCLGMTERILMTPFPLSYSRHTSRLLTLYCLALPMVLVEQLGPFYVVPATFSICWGLFSIDEFAHYIEDPFRKKCKKESR